MALSNDAAEPVATASSVDAVVASSTRGTHMVCSELPVPHEVPSVEWRAVDSVGRYVALAACITGYYPPDGRVYVWDAATGAVLGEKCGVEWGCADGETVDRLKLSPKGAIVALATSAHRVVVHSALRTGDRQLAYLCLHHAKHKARVVDLCWGYKGLYSADADGKVYEFDWKSSVDPTLLVDLGEPVVQLSSRAFVGAYADDCPFLVIVTTRRCVLVDTATGAVATVAGPRTSAAPEGEAPCGACFTWQTGELVVAYPSAVCVAAPLVAVEDGGVELLQRRATRCTLGQRLAPLRDGRVVAARGAGDGGVPALCAVDAHTGEVEVVALGGEEGEEGAASLVDVAFTSHGEVLALLSDSTLRHAYAVRESRQEQHRKQQEQQRRYTNSNYSGHRRTAAELVAAAAASVAALAVVAAAAGAKRRRRAAGSAPAPSAAEAATAPGSTAPVLPETLPEAIEGARRVGLGALATASSLFSTVLQMVEEPAPYRGVLFLAAAAAVAAVSLPLPPTARSRKGKGAKAKPKAKARVIKEGGGRSREAPIADTVRKPPPKPVDVAFMPDEQLVHVDQGDAAVYAEAMRGFVCESERRLEVNYLRRAAEAQREAAAAAAWAGAAAVVAASWGDNPLQLARDGALRGAAAAAACLATVAWEESARRLAAAARTRMCRELVQLIVLNAEYEVDEAERYEAAARAKEEAAARREEEAALALQADEEAASPYSWNRRSVRHECDGDDLLELLAFIDTARASARHSAVAAAVAAVAYSIVGAQQHIKQQAAAALAAWERRLTSVVARCRRPEKPSGDDYAGDGYGGEASASSSADEDSGSQDDDERVGDDEEGTAAAAAAATWGVCGVPPHVREAVDASLVSEVEEALERACAPLSEGHREVLRRLPPHAGVRVVFQHEGTPLWKTQWSAAVLQVLDPPAWAEEDGSVAPYNPVEHPDVLPHTSAVWEGGWFKGCWEYSTHSVVWEQECGMFHILRRRRWTRPWTSPSASKERAGRLREQRGELAEAALGVVREVMGRSEGE